MIDFYTESNDAIRVFFREPDGYTGSKEQLDRIRAATHCYHIQVMQKHLKVYNLSTVTMSKETEQSRNEFRNVMKYLDMANKTKAAVEDVYELFKRYSPNTFISGRQFDMVVFTDTPMDPVVFKLTMTGLHLAEIPNQSLLDVVKAHNFSY